MVETFNFAKALENLMAGGKIARMNWHRDRMFLTMQVPDENSKMTEPYIYITVPLIESDEEGTKETRIPWIASQADLLSDDWYAVA